MSEVVGPRIYCCCNCRNHVSLHDDIISKAFQLPFDEYRAILYTYLGEGEGDSYFIGGGDGELKLVCYKWGIETCLLQGRHGRAFLFSHVMNIVVGVQEDRHLLTGLHTVADVYCGDCREVLGWKYERAYEQSQKYKEGKFILEKSKIMKDNW